MAVKFNVGSGTIKMAEMTIDCLEKLLTDKMMSLFLIDKSKDAIRERFKEALKSGDWVEVDD